MLAASSAGAVTHLGGEFTVTVDSYAGNTGVFTYTADFTNWTGDPQYIFAVDFGLSNPKVASIDGLVTTATGGWTYEIGNTSANGCGGGSSVFACADDDPFSEADGQKTEGVVTWTFTVTFDAALDPSQWTDSDNHIGAFFYTCTTQGGNGPNAGERRCSAGNGLSEETTFGDDDDDDDDDDDTDMPEPGTLALLGLGLLGLGVSRRRKA